ncbi:MAG: hypothetical protein ACLP3B_07200 [Syntrophobacteraceae bacterium]
MDWLNSELPPLDLDGRSKAEIEKLLYETVVKHFWFELYAKAIEDFLNNHPPKMSPELQERWSNTDTARADRELALAMARKAEENIKLLNAKLKEFT